ncbi:hypothetical protein RhiirC2_763862 [Rhizophagus irregularis]|uniref:Uncharacterized protein n=1 Tax=Rhizophagus irregularis TaxID=588596 RepID=A0A2N1M569_9GLOM|nr:hypothetical protein RhiirC2_764228 [Rhizophagus irregularis]PKK56820.1 hypothetical protein RhiirC2_764222 [Rhizophagus irregularis]PKK57594.1 hypothetical protein RhiirC2_763862 [Rhizophagus irregularis]
MSSIIELLDIDDYNEEDLIADPRVRNWTYFPNIILWYFCTRLVENHFIKFKRQKHSFYRTISLIHAC